MIDPLSRRLRVRDDGTGKSREEDGTFAEFERAEAIVLLGDPGMGKTTFFRQASQGSYSTVRKFLIAPQAVTTGTVFLDALDEYRAATSGRDASADVATALCDLKKPKFRLSCRAADWFGSRDQDVISAASASGRVVVLELLPLSLDEILNAVQAIVPDPGLFISEAESAGLGKLLGNPQTLELLARAWGSGKKPQNKFEAYEIGVAELLKETNATHIQRGVIGRDPKELRRAAGAAAATLLLSNSAGISRAETADGESHIRFSVVPHEDKNDLDAVLKRRLFFSSGVDRFEPIHRTIAEFLAAEDISGRIINGLPIDRVMALLCGMDGKPVSSLRGLFAWLMCNLGDRAECYVERDPYGVATYGDPSVLPPKAQCAIWSGLRELLDPWFLANQDDRGSFRDLANANTAKILRELIQDSATGVHLKVAMLEAIASSKEKIGLDLTLRNMVLEKSDNTWIRTRAMRAYAKSVSNVWPILESLDLELARSTDDPAASEVRADLLLLTRAFGVFPTRMLSILEQAAKSKKQGPTGRFYVLMDLPSDTDLDMVLDGAPCALTSKREEGFELQGLFDEWLKRRLENPAPIRPDQLIRWVRNILLKREFFREKVLLALKDRFEKEPFLFEKAFELLATQCEEPSFKLFVTHYLWKLLPAAVWPFPPSEFLLARAREHSDSEKAAILFRMYLTWFPTEGASVALAEAGFDLLDRRHDIANVLGNWKSCKIEKWRRDEFNRREKESRKHSADRAKNIAYLSPRLLTIREGNEEDILGWAALHYHGWFYDSDGALSAHERLVILTNEEIAGVLVEGIIRYSGKSAIPKKEAVIQSWLENSIPRTHTLLSLSVFLRLNAGMSIPSEVLPQCITVALTAFNTGDRVPGHDEALSGWVLRQARENPALVRPILREMWVSCASLKKGNLPGFYELSRDPASRQFLASLSAEVLKTGINEDHNTVRKLVSVLLTHDQGSVISIGVTELARNELSSEVRIIWSTALFVVDPINYFEPWKNLMAAKDTPIWEAIKVIAGDDHEMRKAVSLTPEQRMEIVRSVGCRFPYVGYPIGASSGNENSWNVAEFVVEQIRQLSAERSPNIDAHLKRLEDDGGLTSYRDEIRHQRAQYVKQQRESSFTFASPEDAARAIKNGAPSTSGDLLAFVVDHCNVLSRELARTQRERYRAYWNESGRKLIKPKSEEVCSGLLADDLQNRIRPHDLIVGVEHHMIADKECDLVVQQGTERLLPIEAKHHFNVDLWAAWRTQLDRLYTRDANAGGLGIYLVFWSGEAVGRKMPKLPDSLKRSRPGNAVELRVALESLIPGTDRHRLRVVIVDISAP
jgi:hypothetical protein